MENQKDDHAELSAIATAIRELQIRAQRAGRHTLAYLLDIAALEAEGLARSDAD